MGAGGAVVGGGAAWAAVMTAYVREAGSSLTGGHDFCGPFAKPQRMAALTVAALVTAFDSLPAGDARVMRVGLMVIAVGTVLTIGRRIVRMGRVLRRTES